MSPEPDDIELVAPAGDLHPVVQQLLNEFRLDAVKIEKSLLGTSPRSSRQLPSGYSIGPSRRATQVYNHTYDEARRSNAGCIVIGHLLLGILLEERGKARKVFAANGLTPEVLRSRLDDYQAAGNARLESTVATGSLWRQLTNRSQRVFHDAETAALSRKDRLIEPEHVLLALVAEGETHIDPVLAAMDVDAAILRERILGGMGQEESSGESAAEVTMSDRSRLLGFRSSEVAREQQKLFITPEHLLLAILQEEDGAARQALNSCGVEYDGTLSLVRGATG